jgi:hypothetical protein
MRPHVHACAQQKFSRTHLIEENNGPTICRWLDGSARRTEKPPRSRARGTMTMSIASQESVSPGLASSAGCQLMFHSQL